MERVGHVVVASNVLSALLNKTFPSFSVVFETFQWLIGDIHKSNPKTCVICTFFNLRKKKKNMLPSTFNLLSVISCQHWSHMVLCCK